MDWREKTIQERYGGDEERFNKDYANAVAHGRMNAVDWNDVLLGATTFPEVEEKCEQLIEHWLGYLPHPSSIIKYTPYLRALLMSQTQGTITDIDFAQQVDDHIKLIRNEDLKYNACLEYEPGIYQNYHHNFAPYGQIVRDRLSRFLGYTPNLEHSLIAELWLRDVIANDSLQLPAHMTACDYKAITLVKYREVLLRDGIDAANASPIPKS